MSIKLEIRPESDFLNVTAAGDFSLAEGQRTFLDMLKAVVRHKVRKVLFDGRRLEGEPEAVERFYYGEFAANAFAESAKLGAVDPSMRFAYLLEEPMLDPERFGETVAVSRGMLLKAFDNLQEACAWLEIEHPKKPDGL